MPFSLESRTKLRSQLLRCFLFSLIGFIATNINYPLARFPGQDLIWNDLILLGRVAWVKAALLHHPLASIDFLQSFGSNLRQDIKVIPHFYDPAVFFSLFTGLYHALWLRTFALNVYCLFCLDQLLLQSGAQSPTSSSRLRFPLLSFYVLSPQLFHEVSNHFAAIYFALPGAILALRAFVLRPRLLSTLAFVGATTLFISLSDVHIFIVGEVIATFLLLFDPVIRSVRKRVAAAALVFYPILFFSYLGAFEFIATPAGVTVSRGGWPLSLYLTAFLKHAFESLAVPTFAGPVTVYVAPYLPVIVLALFPLISPPKLRKHALLLSVLAALLFGFGCLCHGVPFFRARLPSTMRYHLTLIPFLASLWILFHAPEIESLLSRLRARWYIALLVLTVTAGLFYKVGCWWWWNGWEPKTPFLAFNGAETGITLIQGKILMLWLLTLYPLLFVLFALFGKVFDFTRIGGALVSLIAFTVMACSNYCIRLLQEHEGPFVDRKMFHELYVDLPEAVDRIIRQSRYAQATRSFIPVAVSLDGTDRGYNDKFQPLIEFPESIHARSFFNWRYSYSAHTSRLLTLGGGKGPICFYPPTPRYTRDAVNLAIISMSPFVISMDQPLEDARLELLGTHVISNHRLERSVSPTYTTGLTGMVFVYGVKRFLEEPGLLPFKSIDYSRVAVHFRDPTSKASDIRLPITYFKDLSIVDQDNQRVPYWKGADGFTYVRNDRSIRELTVSSQSIISLFALLAPLIALIPAGIYAFRFLPKEKLESTKFGHGLKPTPAPVPI